MGATDELAKLGSSLPVPCVMELAKAPSTRVPHRYVRPDQEPAIISDMASPLLQVPVIDMSKLLAEQFMQAELEKLHLACKQWGFFQVRINPLYIY